MKILKILNLFSIIIITVNCVPNFKSPRDVCKEGDFHKQGKEQNANLNCSLAFLLSQDAGRLPAAISKDAAAFICYRYIEDIQNCNKKHTLKTGVNTW